MVPKRAWLGAGLLSIGGLGVAELCVPDAAAQARRAQMRSGSASMARQRAVRLVRAAEEAYYKADYNAVIALCRQAIQANASYPRAYTWLGAAFEKQGRREQARQAFSKVIALAPRSADAGHARTRLRALGPATRSGTAADGLRLYLNGAPLPTATPLQSRPGRVLVPLRDIFQALGASVAYDAATRHITAQRDATSVQMWVGGRLALVNGQRVPLDEPARVVDGHTLVPLRFVSETLGARVRWDAPSGRVAIETGGAPATLTAQAPPEIGSAQTAQPPRPSTETPLPPPASSGAAPPSTLPYEPPAPDAAPAITPVPASPSRPETPPERSIPAAPPAAPLAPPPAARSPLPDVVGAEQLLVGARPRSASGVPVRGVRHVRAYFLSRRDPDMVFQLNREWEWFEAQVATPDQVDGARREAARLVGWFDESPAKEAFVPLQLFHQRAPILLRIRVADAIRLTLAPDYPGRPLVLINPRFIRKKSRLLPLSEMRGRA